MMKEKGILGFIAVFVMFLAVGCQKNEEIPSGTVTDVPLQNAEGTLFPEETVNGSVQEDDSKAVKYSFLEEIEEEKDGDYVYFRSTLYYPVFEGKNAEMLNLFVSSVTEAFREYLPEAKENAEYDYQDSLTEEFYGSIFPEEEEFIVSCLWETEQYITLFTQSVSSAGGVHPNVSCQAYVLSLENGTPVSSERLSEDYNFTMEELVAYVTKKIRNEHGENLYDYDNPSDLEEDIERFIKNNQWYFNEKGLVLFANPYEIAAYAYGMIECEISYEELEQGLKK